MKVLHINSMTSGGAALCALRISEALAECGVESKMLVKKNIPPKDVFVATKDTDFWYSNQWKGRIKHMLMRLPWYWDAEKMELYVQKKNSGLPEKLFLSHPFSNYKNIINHPLIEWADIVHLHWVSGFVDYPSFFKNIKKPIIWTLHDMNPAIGTMHFVSDNSPIPETLLAMEKRFRKIKRKAVMHCQNKMQIVAISEQMKRIIETSDVLSGFPVALIHNGVDTNVYKITEKKCGNNVFMFSSYNIWDKRKGLNRIVKALEKINIHKELIVVGNNPSKKRVIASFPIKEYGLITNQNELASLYSKADYFINASYEEGFAQTPLEAMACGTPVITTLCSGASDLIRPFNGLICRGFDSDALSNGINEALNVKFNSSEIRQYIIDNYHYSIIAEQYKKLYESIVQ